MLFEDTYRTIEKPAEGLFRDRGSKFLAVFCDRKAAYDLKTDTANQRLLHLCKMSAEIRLAIIGGMITFIYMFMVNFIHAARLTLRNS